jgi:DNA-binding MarR family transcriptional regulator
MSELAELLGVSPPSASTMVDRLVDKGVLSREHSTEDRRKVVVRISPESAKNIESVESSILQLFEGLVEKLGPETTRQWCRVLKHVNAVLSDGLQDV